MRALIFALIAGLAPLSAVAEESRGEVFAVYYTHFSCPDTMDGSPGSSSVQPIDAEFGDPYFSARRTEYETPQALQERARFHCRWVRLTGVMRWLEYYHYRARFYESPLAASIGSDISYIVENFSDSAERRARTVQRRVSLVGRFYDLCAAAERARVESNEDWIMLMGPCHYGDDRGMMLADVRVERVMNEAPLYFSGDANRDIFGELAPVEGDTREALVERTRAWAELVRTGPSAFAEALSGQRGLLSEEDQRELRASVEHQDSYETYVHGLRAFRRLDLRRAGVEVFWDDEARQSAIGCVCLERTCGNKWPLTRSDAVRFLGAAVCVALDKDADDSTWRW